MKCVAAQVCRRLPIWCGCVSGVGDGAAWPFNLITLQGKLQMDLMKNVWMDSD